MDEFVPLVDAATSRGINTIVCDGYPDGPAKSYANDSFNFDVRDITMITALCRAQGVDGIIASYSDLLAECLVDIADKTGLPCYAKPDKFQYLRKKTMMKQMFDELGIPTAKNAVIHRETIAADIEPIGFPCVLKPVNGYGSHGIYVASCIEKIEELFDSIVSLSSFDYLIAERMYSGHEYNMMNWILDGEVMAISIADREKSVYREGDIPHVSRIVYPSHDLDIVLDGARAIVKSVADYVGISNGPLSMQFFYSEKDGIQVCEVAGRLFGYEHELVTYASGFSIEEMLLNYAYDHEALRKQLLAHDPHLPHCSCGIYFHGKEGTVADISCIDELKSLPFIEDVTVYYQKGETISRKTGSKPYVVRFYLKADTYEELDETTQKIYENMKVLDSDGNDLLYPNQITKY